MTVGMENPHKKDEPGCGDFNQEYIRQRMEGAPVDRTYIIITEPMIMDCLNELLPAGDEGKYAKMVKLDIKTVTSLKMEYKSISEIDNLNDLTNLTKLQLCCNVIKKIQNLEFLVNLKWLDLSFNSIRKIEGLDTLVKLEVLNLHSNFIRTLENLDNNLRLAMFHISTNKLDELENLRYLRRLVRIRSVSLQGNPVSMDPEFIHYFIAFCPQIDLIDYVYVPKIERDIANARHKVQVAKYAKANDKYIRRASVIEAEEEVKLLHKRAFVDGLLEDELWDSLYEADAEGKVLFQLGDTEDIKTMFKELFRRASKDMFKKGMRAYEERQQEVDAYTIATDEELAIMQKPANMMTEEFVEYGGQSLKDVKILVSLIEDNERRVQNGLAHELPPEFPEFQNQLNGLVKEYVGKLHDIWFTLIHAEMAFNENMESVNGLLESEVRQLVSIWLELLQGQFGQMRDIEEQLSHRLKEAYLPEEFAEEEEAEEEEEEEELVLKDLPTKSNSDVAIVKSEKEIEHLESRMFSLTKLPPNLHYLVINKQALLNCFQTSHDRHLAVIDAKEEDMLERMSVWLEEFSKALIVKEYDRNKARLNEISHFIDTHYARLIETRALEHTTVYISPVRADQECTEAGTCKPLMWYDDLRKKLKIREKKFKQMMQPLGKAPKRKMKLQGAVPTRSSFAL